MTVVSCGPSTDRTHTLDATFFAANERTAMSRQKLPSAKGPKPTRRSSSGSPSEGYTFDSRTWDMRPLLYPSLPPRHGHQGIVHSF
jgi:hypothetical protein